MSKYSQEKSVVLAALKKNTPILRSLNFSICCRYVARFRPRKRDESVCWGEGVEGRWVVARNLDRRRLLLEKKSGSGS